jgi:DNA primase
MYGELSKEEATVSVGTKQRITADSIERKRHSIRAAVAKLKREISIEEFLDARGVELRHSRARCIVHGGDNPQSFSVDPDKQLWICFACGNGGDLIDLCELVEKHADTWTAVISLSQQFNVELPRRSDKWHEWQDEKAKVREAVKMRVAAVYQRRLTRLFAPLVLVGGETPQEELEALEELASALWPVSTDLARRRVEDAT